MNEWQEAGEGQADRGTDGRWGMSIDISLIGTLKELLIFYAWVRESHVRQISSCFDDQRQAQAQTQAGLPPTNWTTHIARPTTNIQKHR